MKTAAVNDARPAASKVASPRERKQPISVLLVEDKPEELEPLHTALDSADLQVVQARTRYEALRADSEQGFQLLIIDMDMDDVDALALARTIRARQAGEHLAIIFLSATYPREAALLRSSGLGALDYMAKPIDPTVLRLKVDVFAEFSRYRQAFSQARGERLRAERTLARRSAELRRLKRELHALEREFHRVQYRERQRLASVLHDHLQQFLVSAKLQLARLEQNPANGQLEDALRDIRSEIEGAIRISRSVTVDLSPPCLGEARLATALEWLAERLREPYQFTVRVRGDRDDGPSNDADRLLLFECTRELLFNAIKHSGVTEAEVELSETPDGRFQIVVRDQGKGFDPHRLESGNGSQKSFGLANCIQRLSNAGATLTLDSAPGEGTRATIVWPDSGVVTGSQRNAQAVSPRQARREGVATQQ